MNDRRRLNLNCSSPKHAFLKHFSSFCTYLLNLRDASNALENTVFTFKIW